MKNWEALKAVMEGWCVRRICWKAGLHVCRETLHQFGNDFACLHDDWEVYEIGHDWAWACAELCAGRAVRRKTWNEDQTIYCGAVSQIVWRDTGAPFVLRPVQILATDWVEAN